MMKKILFFVLFAVLLATLAACAPDSKVTLNKPDTEIQFTPPGTNPELDKPTEAGIVAGLGTGLWHGFISPVTLIISFSILQFRCTKSTTPDLCTTLVSSLE